ncbi:MAG: hypothetical protein FD145_596 [Candidatus Saganbacteria bacterium]|uniref:Uncharacterized protein n=1 Tax=Candidatus Saganbacteria bacterium TaxID=2575572 RepID=A0A833L1P8_UNCSA|nr:MAG: hypothetical protein FD145_596 [Candidatus Saganbacteria bacterium]
MEQKVIESTSQPIEILPYMLGKRKLKNKEASKIDIFEKGLQNEIKKTDTINSAITKIVRMALACEYGAALAKSKGADQMINAIVAGILSDQDLRKQALFIIDRFAA